MSAKQSTRERTTSAETQLSELRDALETARREIDEMFEEILRGLPEWADVDREDLRSLFLTKVGDEPVMIGPPAAIAVTVRVERYLESQTSEAHIEAEASVVELGSGCRSAADKARDELERRLDDLVAALADDTLGAKKPGAPDLTALKRKLQGGRVGAALLEREEQADGLEEQRRRSEALRQAWQPLMELATIVGEMSEDASGRLRALLDDAEPDADEPPEGGEPRPEPTEELERPQPITKPLATPAALAAADAPDAPGELAETPSEPEVEPEPNRRLEKLPRSRVDTDAPRTARDTPLVVPANVTATMEIIAAKQQFREPTFRMLTGWHTVTAGEALLALGPPAAYLAFMTCATLAYQLGLWSENPFELWPAALPTFFAFALWAVGMPAFSGWRIEWDGAKPRAVRLSAHREGGFLEITDSHFEIDNYSYEFDTSSGELTRWETPQNRGWKLIVRNDDGREVLLAAVKETDRWTRSETPILAEEPQGAWRCSAEALLHVAGEIDYW